jgi:hypothetical protein
MGETCFVIMPIGNQTYDNENYSKVELKKKYDDLIKNALETAREGLEIVRADDISIPGSISNDILTRLMFSNYVIADISLPNPNVFYELGIRHAIRARTILLKDKNIKNIVFDISHLRYIEYENTSSGLKDLSEELRRYFEWMDKNPQKPDNQFLELAALMKYQYPKFIDLDEENRKKQQALVSMIAPFLKNPETLKALIDPNTDQETKSLKLIEMMSNDPNSLMELLNNLAVNGLLQN